MKRKTQVNANFRLPSISLHNQRSNSHCPTEDYFNPAAFKETPAFAFGTANRYLSIIDNPLAWNLDAMLEKSIQLTEDYRLSFRAEAFNALNNVTFAGPTTTVTSLTFGGEATLSQANTARQGQLKVRLMF